MTSSGQMDNVGQDQREMSMFDVFNALLLNRRVVIALPLLFFAAVAGYSLSKPRTWTSDASFVPQGGARAGPLAGLAAQFGVPIGATDGGESPAFYAALIHSRAVLGAVLDSSHQVVRDGRSVSLPIREIIDPAVSPANGSRELALRRLQRAIAVSTERETGLIRISATTEDPQLSERIGSLLLSLINEFNLEKRQVQAAAERRFVEERLVQARGELADAEARLQRFEEANRRMGSPQLMLIQSRLLHEVGLRRQVVTSLAEAFERARIDEVRNLPLITIIDRPIVAERPNGRGTVLRSLFALALGFAIAAAYALFRATLQSSSSRRPDAELFRRLRHEAAAEASRPFRRIVRSSARGESIAERDDPERRPIEGRTAAQSSVAPRV